MDTNMITFLACICFIFIFGRIFIVPDNDVVYFVQKFGTVPQRCATCRNNRRKHFEEASEVTSD